MKFKIALHRTDEGLSATDVDHALYAHEQVRGLRGSSGLSCLTGRSGLSSRGSRA